MQSYIFDHGYGYSKILCRDVSYWFLDRFFPRHKIIIDVLHRGLKREEALGFCDISGSPYNPREFLIEMQSHLDKETYVRVLLHELYHVKQFVSGELKLRSMKKYYNGKCVEDLEYWKQPHEIMAHRNEKILYQQYIRTI